jgi:predicted transcriptional regulator
MEMTKQIAIGNKSVTMTQLVIAIIIGAFALGGGFFGMLKAEDRWNQTANCYENALKTVHLEETMTAGMQQMFYQQNVKFEEQRLTTLHDQLTQAQIEYQKNPNSQYHKDRVIYLQGEINRVKSNLQKLHEEKVN